MSADVWPGPDYRQRNVGLSSKCSDLGSHFATSKYGRGQHIKYRPYAFSEHAAIQAANVLNSPPAIAMRVFVVRAFVRLRELPASISTLTRKLDELERKDQHHDETIPAILSAIRELTNLSSPKRRGIGLTADLGDKP